VTLSEPTAAIQVRRTHPITPIVQVARAAPALVLFLFFVSGQGDGGGATLLLALGGLLAIALIGSTVAYLQWQRKIFWFDTDGDLRVNSGILTRNERRVQLSRLQGVEVVQPLLARLAGMAQVKVESAGSSGDSTVLIEYLALSDAEALRAEVLARSAGVTADAPTAPEDVLHVVPTNLLVKSLILRGATAGLLAITVLVVTFSLIFEGPGGLILILFTGGVPLFTVFTEFSRFFDFTVARSPDGLRLRYGLLQRQAHTVPPGRVQAIGFVEPLLWRQFGWVRVHVDLAGSSGGDGQESVGRGVLLPVAPWPVALQIASALMPGSDASQHTWFRADEKSRYSNPFQWRQLAVAYDERMFGARGGWLTHRTSFVPHARTQSVEVTQGPLQRSLGLASIEVHSVEGPVSVIGAGRPAGQARQMADAQAARAEQARREDRSVRWMKPPPERSGDGG